MNLTYQRVLPQHLLSAGSLWGPGDAGVALPSRGLWSQDQAPCPAGEALEPFRGAINAAHAQSAWRQGGPRVPSGHHTAGTNVPSL